MGVLGFSTNALVRFSLREAVREVASLGFRGVEIMCDRPHLYPPDFQRADLTALLQELQELGLSLTNLNSFTLFAVGDTHLPSWIEQEDSRRGIRIQHTKDCLWVAHLLGCSNISVPPGGPSGGLSTSRAMRLFLSGLEEVIPVAESLGVSILIEPEPGLLIENSRQCLELMRCISSERVGINFDVGHFFCAGEDPSASLEELFGWVGHMHLEDIPHTREHHHLIPGLGGLDFRGFFRTVKDLGYEGDASLELYTYADRPTEAAKKAMDHLLPIILEMGLSWEIPQSGPQVHHPM